MARPIPDRPLEMRIPRHFFLFCKGRGVTLSHGWLVRHAPCLLSLSVVHEKTSGIAVRKYPLL